MTKLLQKKRVAEAAPLRPAMRAVKASDAKWGKSVMDLGFCIVPSLLLRAQARLGLSPAQLAVLLHLADYWWDAGRNPYPGKCRLAGRLKLGPRQLQRHIAELERAGLVRRIERRAPNKGKLSNEYDLSGLVARLAVVEPEFRPVQTAGGPLAKAPVRAGGRHGVA